jgi:hypothetical protein
MASKNFKIKTFNKRLKPHAYIVPRFLRAVILILTKRKQAKNSLSRANARHKTIYSASKQKTKRLTV